MPGPFTDQLAHLGITLPPVPKPVAAYVPYVRTGAGAAGGGGGGGCNLVFVSGQLPTRDGKLVTTGPVPTQVSPDDAKQAARLACINALAALADACGGDLDKVVRIVRLGVFVQSAEGFAAQPAVANGASELLVQIFGDAGKHARAAVGANTLPLNATVEVELIAEVRP